MAIPARQQGDGSAFWAGPVDALLSRLQTKTTGLTGAEATRRLAAYGPNEPAAVKRTPGWLRFAARLGNPLVIVLIVASGLSAITGDVSSFVIVVAIVTLSMVLDFVPGVAGRERGRGLAPFRRGARHGRRDGSAVRVPVDRWFPAMWSS